ncbi:MAG: hypothetical protein HYR80_01340 [Nitrospirae bacterium]|nr:hypothetical protein [Nitrospirota bacterium]
MKKGLRHFLFLMVILLFSSPSVFLAESLCPPEGNGGDRILNRLKNRMVPPTTYEEMAVNQFLSSLTPDLHTPKYRNKFSLAALHYVDQNEKRGIALVGYLIAAKQSGPESTNCHSQTRRDFHVWIGTDPAHSKQEAKAMRSRAVIVEPTPNGQELHPSWRLHILEKLAKQGARVRISGWAMYDPEHPDQLGKTRGTIWEVHPVTKIEVWTGNQWREL